MGGVPVRLTPLGWDGIGSGGHAGAHAPLHDGHCGDAAGPPGGGGFHPRRMPQRSGARQVPLRQGVGVHHSWRQGGW
eukprot:787827-Prorocentrum_minimum.AAC.1